MLQTLARVSSTFILAARRTSSTPRPRRVRYICGQEEFTGNGKAGDNLLDVVLNSDLPLDGFGACDGTLACCTCHVILDREHFARVDLVNPTSDEELDLLDLAPELHDRSRLGCQIKVLHSDPEEIVVTVPTMKRDARQL